MAEKGAWSRYSSSLEGGMGGGRSNRGLAVWEWGKMVKFRSRREVWGA